jgi:hypothetical protein
MPGTRLERGADFGFRILTIVTSNMKDASCKPEGLLFQVLLDWGVDLSLPISRGIA